MLKLIVWFLLLSSIGFILIDEILMGRWQRRIGPSNTGLYGILPAIINGFNLITSHIIVPNLHHNYGYQCFAIIYLIVPFPIYILLYPPSTSDIPYSLFLFIFLCVNFEMVHHFRDYYYFLILNHLIYFLKHLHLHHQV